jgi:hypothetical protein
MGRKTAETRGVFAAEGWCPEVEGLGVSSVSICSLLKRVRDSPVCPLTSRLGGWFQGVMCRAPPAPPQAIWRDRAGFGVIGKNVLGEAKGRAFPCSAILCARLWFFPFPLPGRIRKEMY